MGEKDTFLSILENNIATVISQDNNEALAKIEKRLEELQAELLKLASTKSDYEDVADEIYTLREEKQKVQVDSASKDEIKKRIADMTTFLKDQATTITEYDEALVRRLIEKVTIHEGKFTVEFMSGLTVDIEE